ncbi:protein CBFA2T1 isoform X1 [Cynoglossus semilaevis]|uniref:RUNX1 partner transcriptional co-repressor 1 n=1 Tax=Cynoglossus semilaevis TaxID=244447 RepID=A0A3P8WPQ6_CYNSE|nr:protein CBFA2T1 isoform X1 [Cynoglossus semilaevis]XP_024920813.1 protein CBFA2T1 isoform X1 [Cynoglossus semilaevis]XP_024920814.1 protein CBFA2T1 isoform X1 [Cynoglossus semilaevis]XP_024920815.1 protein CBFA2T1 isoform X1 [Cynoglossus semilaevis]XP_024920816.1 protein CBFA2T1 isoform X1 [Cynoglossus semilaevis]
MVGISASFQYRTGKRSTMPDSPADVKTQSRLTPPTMPPPPSTQGVSRNSSYTPTTLTNGSSHSPTALNGAPSPPNGYSNGPSSSSSSSLANQQLPPACGARQLSKLKRFLTTLQQFGNDISPEIGERVRTLVLGLVNSTLTIEEFHSKLQEATNFPLRPFVIPFLKANLPLLQRELLHCARLAKQNPAQYLAQHEQLLLDTSTTSPVDSSELLLDVNENGKRRTPDRTKENGFEREGNLHPDVHPSKRPCTISPAQRFSPSNGISYQPNGLPHPGPLPPQHYRLDDMAIAHHYRDSYRHSTSNHREIRERARSIGMHAGTRQEEVIDHRLTDREWAEEWKHLDHVRKLLNCIMDMVEKTRRSLTVLRRCQEADREELNYWIRRYSDAEELKKGSTSTQSRQQSPAAQETAAPEIHRELMHRPVSGYVPEEIWKKAGTGGLTSSVSTLFPEEAVNEVKRQAMSELQKAVSEAERKAHEMISSERAKMERTVAEAKRQAAEDALSLINQQEDSSESCWNCGRKASETCSGCNTARYCGSFCQHKDWEKHHHVCGQTLQAQQQQQAGQQQGGIPGSETPAPISSSACTPSSGTGSPAATPPAATPRSSTPSTPSSSALDGTPR